MENVNEAKFWLFEQDNTINNALGRVTKNKKEREDRNYPNQE